LFSDLSLNPLLLVTQNLYVKFDITPKFDIVAAFVFVDFKSVF